MPYNRIPDRWLDYSAIGGVLGNSRFVAMKTPLSGQLLSHVPLAERFSCEDVLLRFQRKHIRLGLIIDLTCTTRYYDPEFFRNRGVQHCKIFVQGKQVPSGDVVKQFREVVEEFHSRNHDNDSVIAVHCTHGVNRTGYMICRYLIDNKNFEPEQAIELFGRSRGYGIERSEYIDHLKSVKSSASANSWVSANSCFSGATSSAYSQDGVGKSYVSRGNWSRNYFPTRTFRKPYDRHIADQSFLTRAHHPERFRARTPVEARQDLYFQPQIPWRSHPFQSPRWYSTHGHRPVDYPNQYDRGLQHSLRYQWPHAYKSTPTTARGGQHSKQTTRHSECSTLHPSSSIQSKTDEKDLVPAPIINVVTDRSA